MEGASIGVGGGIGASSPGNLFNLRRDGVEDACELAR